MSYYLLDYIDRFRNAGFNITIKDYYNKGFPSEFKVHFDDISYKNNYKNFGWKTKKIIVTPPILESKTIILNVTGDNFFSYRKRSNAPIKKIATRSDRLQILLEHDQEQFYSVLFSGFNIILQFHSNDTSYNIKHFKMHVKNSNILNGDRVENIIQMDIDAKNIEPPILWKSILEDNFLYLKGNIYLRNPSLLSFLPDFDLYVERGYDQPEIVLENIELKHSLSTIKLNGLLGFDDNYALNGKMILTISDYQKILRFLNKKGVVSNKVAANFRFMLSFLLSTKKLEKNDGSVDVELIVKNNKVYRGDILLFELDI